MSATELPQIYLIRHGETDWSRSGRHTSHTDLPLTAAGEEQALGLKDRLHSLPFSLVWSSPRQRAQRTGMLAGFASSLVVNPDLAEWHYGDFEGLTTEEIRQRNPDWNLFQQGCPGGESLEQVGRRADRLVATLRTRTGNIALFSHGHFLRVLAARWVGWPAAEGRRLLLKTGSISVLSFEHNCPDEPAIGHWNNGRQTGAI